MLAMADQRSRRPPWFGIKPTSRLPNYHSNLGSPITSNEGDSLSDDRSGSLENQTKKASRHKSTPWSSHPRPLHQRHRAWWYWDLVVDITMVLIPLPFYVLVGAVMLLNGKTVDKHLPMLQEAIKATTTAFPILFAIITGRAAVKCAAWKLERGATLGLLEQLMGSRTVGSSIMTQIYLRSFNTVGIGLIILWSLSPIGSQSVLHILSDPLVSIPSEIAVTYFNLRQRSFGSPDGPFETNWFNGFSILFGSSLLAPSPVKDSSMDLWGNPKIPALSSIVSSGAIPDIHGWFQVPQDDFQPAYSSLFGLPVQGMGLGNTTFNVETSYIELTCSNVTTMDQKNSTGGFQKTKLISKNGPYFSYQEVLLQNDWALGYRGPSASQMGENATTAFVVPQNCPDCLSGDIENLSLDSGTLLYEEYIALTSSAAVSCKPLQVYVESVIICQKTGSDQHCQVTAQRPSLLPHAPSSITYLSFPQIALGLTKSLYNATLGFDISNPVQGFLFNASSNQAILLDPSSLSLHTSVDNLSSRLDRIPMQDFSNHLSQLINAWVHGSFFDSTLISVGAPISLISDPLLGGVAASFIPTAGEDLIPLIQNRTSAFTTPATLSSSVHIYRCDFLWTGTFFIATTAMFFAAVIGVVFSRLTITPEYLGYVSTIAKESTYVRMPHGGANLDGMDRSRLMKNLHVRLGNVIASQGDVGHLAFARLEDTVIVRKDSHYV